jgi:hypothetical protein
VRASRAHKRSVGVLIALSIALLTVVAGPTAGRADLSAPGAGGAVATEPLDLVWISDSSGWGVAPFYGREMRNDLGVKVRVHDMWEGDLAGAAVLSRLRTKGHEWIPLIRNAEVIFVTANPVGLSRPEGGNCVSDLPKPPGEPTAREWAGYVGGLKAIYRRIFAIRKGKSVILRTGNWYTPTIAQAPTSPFFPHISWEEAGLVDECTKEFEAFAGAIARAAGAYRVPVADVYTAFNGKDHREDPVAKGYIQADGIHISNKGRAVIAKTVADLGFKKVMAPR